MNVTLPWPPSVCSPNNRSHRMAKARAAKAYRFDCGMLALAAGWKRVKADPDDGRSIAVTVKVTFCPPDARRRDLDGMVSSCKAAFDAIADVIGIDDSRWHWTFERADQVKGGAVLVEVRA